MLSDDEVLQLNIEASIHAYSPIPTIEWTREEELEDHLNRIKEHLEELRVLEEKEWNEWIQKLNNVRGISQVCYEGNALHILDKLSSQKIVMVFGKSNDKIDMVVTDQNVYLISYPEIDIENYIIGPVYTFQERLTVKNLQLLCEMYQMYKPLFRTRYVTTHKHDFFTNLEYILRLIPGYYKNAKWKQINGFFGMYYNQQTNKLITYPPA